MRAILLSMIVLVFTSVSAFAQVEKGDLRIGGAFDLEAYDNETNIDFDLDLGYSFTDHLELGGMFSVVKPEGVDTYGTVAATGIYHFAPAKVWVPGVGADVGTTYGLNDNGTLWGVFFNLDAFVTENWSVNFRAGYESTDFDAGKVDGFALRVGIATFLGLGN